jgi:hypothetical protein
MSPFSGPVLGGAAVLSAPALWSSLVVGATPVADGLLRYMIAVLVCWFGLGLLAAMVGPAPRVDVKPGTPTDTQPLTRHGTHGGEGS